LLDENAEGTTQSEATLVEDKTHFYSPEALETPSKSGSSVATFQTASSTVPFKSPLDPTPPMVAERSITGFSIGGEAVGGWHTPAEEHPPWHQHHAAPAVSQHLPTTSTPAAAADDDDSDDDKPIMQALQEKQQQREVSTVRL
jgi:hypothetical protein